MRVAMGPTGCPRTTAIVRKAARAARLMRWTGAPAVLLRDALITGVSRIGPTLVLRTFDGIADWQPPGDTYAARTKDAHRPPR
ncbi:hypothetical protein ACFWOJ_33435 [Streptomyces sp. NPDC058439]|uniref:hypothetical protein n=1 Tax=Streptomyces sp. NPDC058439 TaxID=3346500 RepID=UPI00364A8442